MLLHKHTAAVRGVPSTSKALACRPSSLSKAPRSLHIMRFKEGEKLEEDVSPKAPQQQLPEPTQDQTVHHGHMDPIKRSRDALSQLLGRHTSSNGISAAMPAAPARPARSSLTPSFEAPLNVPVFSRRREVLVGRVAMAAFYATCQWEVLTGLGPISQMSVTTGLPRIAVQLLLAAFVVHGLYGFSPSTPTWSAQNRNDLLRRPRGVPRAFVNPFTEPGRFFGYSEWGFTKANEVFAGRLAMLGWLGVALTEPFAEGKGPIGQMAWWLHVPTFQAYYQFAGLLLVVLPIIFGALAYVNKRPGQVAGGDDIY